MSSGPITVINLPQVMRPCYPMSDEPSVQESDFKTLAPGKGIDVSQSVNAWQGGCGYADRYTGEIRVAKGDVKTLRSWAKKCNLVSVVVVHDLINK